MIPKQAVNNKYDARIRRAQTLISERSSASEILSFYKRIVEFQKGVLARIADESPRTGGPTYGSVRDLLDLAVLLPHFGRFLWLVREHGPGALADAARAIAESASEGWIEMLSSYWEAGGRSDGHVEAFQQFFPRAFLEPYAEYIADSMAIPPATMTARVCPVCGARPLLGLLRPEGDGGKRWMLCSFCGHEWEFRRILCPACGEEEEKKLPVYLAEQLPHVRVETCETCKFFVRTIDLTKDGHAVPVVDDLAAIPLTLWAHEHGYTRLQANLFGT
jgi:FdhE protein